jgi:hypothetical protein
MHWQLKQGAASFLVLDLEPHRNVIFFEFGALIAAMHRQQSAA